MRRTYNILFLALAFCLSVTSSFAHVIGEDEARLIAAGFFNCSSNQGGNAVQSRDGTVVLNLADEPDGRIYVFNREDGQGWVIVSGESQAPEILAYSNHGSFNPDPRMASSVFLESYRSAIDGIRNGEMPALSGTRAGNGGSKYLETAHFSQNGYSFNSSIAPKVFGRSCQAGCTATAMAIIMKYHEWPESNTGSFSYTTTTRKLHLEYDFALHPFRWKEMENTPTSRSTDAVSNLLKACGVSVAMDYDNDASAAYLTTVQYALRHYFHYDNAMYLYRELYDTEDWNAILRAEIAAERPVAVSGSSKRGWHTFVLDGYDANGMFHYNLGWGGDNDGFYSDGMISSDRFSVATALVGIRPGRMDAEDFASPLLYNGIRTTVDGNLAPGYVLDIEAVNLTNMSNTEFTGQVRADVFSSDFKYRFTVHPGFSQAEAPCPPGSYWGSYRLDFCQLGLADRIQPSDFIAISSSTDGGKTWQPVYSSSSLFHAIPVSGYHDTCTLYSQMAFQDGDAEGIIVSGKIGYSPFYTNTSGIYNFSQTTGFSGTVNLMVCDTLDWSVVDRLSSNNVNTIGFCNGIFGYFGRVSIARDIVLKPSYALAVFTKLKGMSDYALVCSYSKNPIYIRLKDFIDIPDAVDAVSAESVPGLARIFSLDGRTVGQFEVEEQGVVPESAVQGLQSGIWLVKFPGGEAHLISIE